MKRPTLTSAFEVLQEPAPPVVRPQKVYNARATPKRQGMRGFTVYVTPAVHAELCGIRDSEGITLEALLLEGVNYVLQSRNKKPTA